MKYLDLGRGTKKGSVGTLPPPREERTLKKKKKKHFRPICTQKSQNPQKEMNAFSHAVLVNIQFILHTAEEVNLLKRDPRSLLEGGHLIRHMSLITHKVLH